MHTYKVQMPYGKPIEFKSKHHLSMMYPKVVAHGNYIVNFEDAEVALNLINIKEIEINGNIHKIQL